MAARRRRNFFGGILGVFWGKYQYELISNSLARTSLVFFCDDTEHRMESLLPNRFPDNCFVNNCFVSNCFLPVDNSRHFSELYILISPNGRLISDADKKSEIGRKILQKSSTEPFLHRSVLLLFIVS